MTGERANRYCSFVHALVLAALVAGGASAADCAASYDAAYELDWSIRREDWYAACALGYDKAEALRALQKRSVEQCAQRFTKPAKEKKMGETQVRSFCAQGAAGRVKLEHLVAEPKPAAPAASAPQKASPLKDVLLSLVPDGLGPAQEALDGARSRWKQSDACLAAFAVTVENLDHVGLEAASLRYRFYSKARWQETFEYRLLKGKPVEGKAGRKSTGNHCLAGVEIDGPEALRKAESAGLRIEGASAFELRLDSFSTQMQQALGRAALAKPPYEALRDKTFWQITRRPKVTPAVYVIDARSGEMLYRGAPFSLDAFAAKGPPKDPLAK